MECLSPISIVDPRYGNPKYRVTVPCGKCFACLSRRRQDWCFRLKQELKVSKSAFFITLTYDDEHLPRNGDGVPIVVKRDVQLFFKRLRKAIYPQKIRYFAVSEYGTENLRPHYHVILFDFPLSFNLDTILRECWYHGFVSVGNVNGASINYVCKYCLAYTDVENFPVRPFMLCSRRPAIGSNYISNDAIVRHHRLTKHDYVVNDGGFKSAMPRYYREKIFSSLERNLLSEKRRIEREERERKQFEKDFEIDCFNVDSNVPTMQEQRKLDYVRKISKSLKKSNKL